MSNLALTISDFGSRLAVHSRRLLRPLLLTLAAATALSAGSIAGANGDTNLAVLRCEISDTTPTTNQDVELSCSLIDALGVPLTSTDVTLFINYQAKTDANWIATGRTAALATTDAEGKFKALFNTGPRPGSLGILANFPGVFSYFVPVQVTNAPVEPAPPAGGVSSW